MIRIFENRNLIAIPVPVVAIIVIHRRDAKIKSAEPEPVPIPSRNPPHMSATESARKPSMLKRTIHAISRVIATRIMSHPLAIVMDVRSFGMSRFVIEPAVIRLRLGARSFRTWRLLPGRFLTRLLPLRLLVPLRLLRLNARRRRPLLRHVSVTDVLGLFLWLSALIRLPLVSPLRESDHRSNRKK